MPRLDVIASITDPSRSDCENEDRLGWNETAAFVIDGATSLGSPIVEPPRSDAAWLAEFARVHFERDLSSGRATESVVRELNMTAAMRFTEACRGEPIESFRHPTASFLSLRIVSSDFEVAGLGDCVVFLKDAMGNASRWSGLRLHRSREQEGARRALAHVGGFDSAGVLHQASDVLSDLRRRRAKCNVPGGFVWTLGVETAAADHIAFNRHDVELPAVALLCTDGFADLVDNYAAYSIDGLLAQARKDGLAGLLSELRRIERQVDPQGTAFPRYKQSDDASAILLVLTA